ncbi:THO complex subunit 4-like [Procambarus clarkii]|uniref:THO complex subunit 4-like n=1 Tax=Procambarus clarkii TaxID=6728 RepID=UPI001E6776C6|nr:THO complex subunit 4-like [Procambarus clarkii]
MAADIDMSLEDYIKTRMNMVGSRTCRDRSEDPQRMSVLSTVVVASQCKDMTDKELFAEFGTIINAAVNNDNLGKSLGTAYIVFAREADALQALKQYNGFRFHGRPIGITMDGGSAGSGDIKDRLDYNRVYRSGYRGKDRTGYRLGDRTNKRSAYKGRKFINYSNRDVERGGNGRGERDVSSDERFGYIDSNHERWFGRRGTRNKVYNGNDPDIECDAW